MIVGLEAVRRSLVGVAGTSTVGELGSELSRLIGRVVPHEGFIIVGMDPITSVGSFHTMENGYSAGTIRGMSIDFARGRSTPIRVLASGAADPRYNAQLRNMAADGFESELRVELTHSGRTWGVLALLRERGRTPFSSVHAGYASQLIHPIVGALKGFVGNAPRSPRDPLPPGVVIVGHDDTTRASTSTGREALRGFAPAARPDTELISNVWELTHRVRRTGRAVLCRVLTLHGFVALHAEHLDGAAAGDVAVGVDHGYGAMIASCEAKTALSAVPASETAIFTPVSGQTGHHPGMITGSGCWQPVGAR